MAGPTLPLQVYCEGNVSLSSALTGDSIASVDAVDGSTDAQSVSK